MEWKDKITFFQAGFNANGAEMTAEFNSKGEWLQSEKKISFEGLPDAVKDGFKKSKYTDWTTGSVTQVETKDKGTEYKIYIEKSSIVQKKFLYFNSQGQLQKETPGI